MTCAKVGKHYIMDLSCLKLEEAPQWWVAFWVSFKPKKASKKAHRPNGCPTKSNRGVDTSDDFVAVHIASAVHLMSFSLASERGIPTQAVSLIYADAVLCECCEPKWCLCVFVKDLFTG